MLFCRLSPSLNEAVLLKVDVIKFRSLQLFRLNVEIRLPLNTKATALFFVSFVVHHY